MTVSFGLDNKLRSFAPPPLTTACSAGDTAKDQSPEAQLSLQILGIREQRTF